MTPNLHRMLLLAALAAAPALPATVIAEPAAIRGADAPRPTDSADGLSAQDRDVLAAAEQLAAQASQTLEQWITMQATTEDRLFARLYFPIASTDPQKYSSTYDALADRDLVKFEDIGLAHAPALQYAIVTDSNAYVPAHNSRFTQPLSGVVAQDYINNRTKRILGDLASITAARSEARYLIQRIKLETGDVIYDISVPVTVRGKHWGCARIGYSRTE